MNTLNININHNILKRKVLVIGGAGYIGSHIVDSLCNLDFDVTVLDNLSSGFEKNVDSRAKLVVADILNVDQLDQIMSQGFDAVFHFAALKNVGESMFFPEKYSMTNIVGTLNILNSMSKYAIKNIIFSSSAATYGSPKYLPMDESHPTNPENYYGFTKLEIERFLDWYAKTKNINYAALRYFNAAGYSVGKCKEKNPGNLLPIVMEVACGMRKEVHVYGNDFKTIDGTGVRDYIHVLDLADAHLKAMDYIIRNKKNLIVNLSTQKGTSVLEIINETKKITGKSIPYQIVERRLGDPAIVVASSELAFKLLKWKPIHSDMSEIISSMWDVYKI